MIKIENIEVSNFKGDIKMWIVYMHQNKINEKKYIGITKQTLSQRSKANGLGYKNCCYFYNAIKKYGWNNFDHIIVYVDLTEEEACLKERELIQQYNTMNEKYGYNLTSGGEKGVHFSQSTLEKKRINMTGSKNPNYGKVGPLNPFYGKKHSDETKQYLSKIQKGGNNNNAKPILCVNTEEVFPSGREASEWCGVARQNITRCCLKGRPTAGKHPITGEKLKWRYLNDKD